MSNEEIKKDLVNLTDGMLYISESEYEIDVQDWGVLSREDILTKISSTSGVENNAVVEQETAAFFGRTIKALDPSDELAAEIATQYKALQAYLQSTFNETSVYRAGEIQVHIFITCFTNEGSCFALHTVSVET